MSFEVISSTLNKHIFENILSVIYDAGKYYSYNVYLVGGAVRDILLNGTVYDQTDLSDIDLSIEGDALKIALFCQNKLGGSIKPFEKFNTAKWELDIKESSTSVKSKYFIDFCTARTERYLSPGSLPEVKSADILSDLKRRDFTVNAIASVYGNFLDWFTSYNMQAFCRSLIDPTDGLKDINQRLIRILHDKSFYDDPTRLYRAFRYKAKIDGKFEDQTEYFIRTAVNDEYLNTVSDFRKVSELIKSWQEKSVRMLYRLLHEYDMFKVFPKLSSNDSEILDVYIEIVSQFALQKNLLLPFELFFVFLDCIDKSQINERDHDTIQKPVKDSSFERLALTGIYSKKKRMALENIAGKYRAVLLQKPDELSDDHAAKTSLNQLFEEVVVQANNV
jgi:tRNA nucleotidyltransferase/poly(A) polymerase